MKTTAAAIMSRLLLVLGLLLADLAPDARGATTPTPATDATDLVAEQIPAILPLDSTRLVGLPEQDDPAAAVHSAAATVPATHGDARASYRPVAHIRPDTPHLRPQAQGPPAA